MSGTYEMRNMTEQQEGEFVGAMAKLQDVVGPEAFEEIVIRVTLPYEAFLRRTESPDHPSLQLLDRWRAKKERGFE